MVPGDQPATRLILEQKLVVVLGVSDDEPLLEIIKKLLVALAFDIEFDALECSMRYQHVARQ